MAGIVTLGLISYASAVAGIFFHATVLIFSIPIITVTLILLFRWILRETISTRMIFTCLIALSFALLLPVEPSVFSGRDQGSIAEAAIELAHNGTLHFSSPAVTTFSDIYGPGKALNFPGFYYDDNGKLTTQFPIGSISFLATFVSLFGITGLLVANGVLLIASLSTLYVLVRTLANERYAVGTFFAGALSFLPLWFSKFTLSENLSLFLFLFLSLTLVRFLRKPDSATFFVSFFLAIFFAATRFEGLFSLAVSIVILFLTPSGRKFSEKDRLMRRIVPVIILIAALFINVFSSTPMYRSIGKALLQDGFATEHPIGTNGFASTVALWNLFIPYGLFLPFVLGIISLVLLLFRKRFLALIPAMLAIPTFLFLIDPTITPDHPWMLRRFLFSLWPTFFVSVPVASYLFIKDNKSRVIRSLPIALFVLIVIFSLPATTRSFSVSENRGLINETSTLTRRFGNRDLLLIDREATGDPYTIPAGPIRFLYGKNAAYFFNPSDYEKIPKDRYDHIYLLTPIGKIPSQSDIRATVGEVSIIPFSFQRLERLPLSVARLPKLETVSQDAALVELKPL
ncbi:MAG: hypothetical protein HGA31_00930 [Candidatus Moranbacteria bacterium]|nr:hypothetical protein [Candidatus Moranbacteria bacterium]